MVYFLLFIIIVFIAFYRNYDGQGVNKFITEQVGSAYEKVAPYSFKVVREKTKQLGREYTPRQYMIQALILGGFAGVVSYLYFYNIMWTIIYIVAAIAFIPYLSYLRCKREYSEFLFEQIQVYTSNTIMEFATTQSFVKAIEGVRDSGILDDPVKTDVNHMNNLYPYYIVKNMHQLFLQITKEGAKDAMDSLENLQLDIDMLVESVYRDRIERATFHKKFLQFGVMLYLLVMLIQVLLGTETYLELLNRWYIALVLHSLIIINSYFLLKGEKYYNENVGAE